jgi:hypothetical protein
MKTLKISLLVAVCVTFVACGASKKSQTASVPKGETEIVLPCGEFKTDADFFRGIGQGQSRDASTAREKARMNANSELASSISVMVKRVAERYVNDSGQSPADYAEVFESITREVVEQQVSNTIVACSKMTTTQDGMYKSYMALEADKNKVLAAMDARMAADKKMETLYNREKFREQFNAEMAAFDNGR